MLGVLEYLLRYAQRVVDLSRDVDDYEFEGPISPGPNWDQSPNLPMGQEILFNGGERISSKFLVSFDLQWSPF